MTQRGPLLTCLLVVVSLLPGPTRVAYASDLSSDIDSVCEGTSANTTADGAQKAQYCKAAKSANHGANADAALWKVWAAVGVVCTYGCVASFTPAAPSSEYVCMSASLAGGITDAAVTKQYTSVLTTIASTGMGYAANLAMNKGSAATKAGTEGGEQAAKKNKDIGACLNAATATIQSFSKHRSMKSGEKSAKENLESVRKLGSDAAASAGQTGFQPQGSAATAGIGGAVTSTSGSNITGDGSDASANAKVTSTCSAAKNGSGASDVLQCALASDRALPSFVTDPRFAKEFQKNSGTSLADFLTRDGSPGAMVGAAASNGLSGAQASKLATGLGELEAKAPYLAQQGGDSGAGSSMYRGGGAGGAGAEGGDAIPDMGQMMAGLMGQIGQMTQEQMQGGGENARPTGVSAVVFANKTRSPASIVEDRSLNIFDRVTYRYYFVGSRMLTANPNPMEGRHP